MIMERELKRDLSFLFSVKEGGWYVQMFHNLASKEQGQKTSPFQTDKVTMISIPVESSLPFHPLMVSLI